MGCTQAKNSKAIQPKLNAMETQQTNGQLIKQTGMHSLEQMAHKEEKSVAQKQLEPTKQLISLRTIQTHTMKQLYLQEPSDKKLPEQQKNNPTKSQSKDQAIFKSKSSAVIQPQSQGCLSLPGKLSFVQLQSIREIQKENIIDEKDINFGFDEYQFQVPEIPKIKEFQYRGTMCAVYNF